MRRPLVWFALANTGLYALVPPLLTSVALPLGLLAVEASGNAQATAIYVDYGARLLVPVLAAWWPLFVFKERLEGDGRELLYLLRRRGESLTAGVLAGLYLALSAPFVVLAASGSALQTADLPLVCARCAFLAALAFWGAFTLRSSALAFIPVLAFNIGLAMPFERITGQIAGPWQLAANGTTAAYLILTLGMFAHGEVMSRRFTG